MKPERSIDEKTIRKHDMPLRLLRFFIMHRNYDHSAIGDLQELYEDRLMDGGRLHASLWIWRQVLRSLPIFIIHAFIWRIIMLKNYLKVALRNIKRYKAYSFINISGLAVGLACCILIFLWVQDEWSYDRYHQHADRVFRISYGEREGETVEHIALSPFAAAPIVTEEIPEIVAFTRLQWHQGLFLVGEETFEETDIFYVDADFFAIFSHEFLAGDPTTALSQSGSAVLTESTARKLFGSSDILGRILHLREEGNLQVTAVIADVPPNSHCQFRALISNHRIRQTMSDLYTSWDWIRGWSYVLLRDGAEPDDVVRKINQVALKHRDEEAVQYASQPDIKLQRITDVHLTSHLLGELETNGSMQLVVVFSLIAVFILLIACINFMNLATARSANRSKEVGMRKVMGAQKGHLIHQFLSETVLTAAVALAVALMLVVLILPAFNQLTSKNLYLDFLSHGNFWGGMAVLILVTGAVSGSYPAFYLSSFQPIVTLRKTLSSGLRGSVFRSVLVVLQFSVSIALIISTVVIVHQLKFMKHKDLGFDKEQVLVVSMRGSRIQQQAGALKQALLRNPRIRRATVSFGVPGRVHVTRGIMYEGQPEDEQHELELFFSDYDFARTYGIKIIKGRDFSEKYGSDASGAFLLNETAARRLGWGVEAVGKKVGFSTDEMKPVVGIVKDFHFASLRSVIAPMGILLTEERVRQLSLKVDKEELQETIAFVEETWKTFEPHLEFRYRFTDSQFDALYRSEDRLGRIITVFSAIAIAVACLGLFGLASYTAEQRTKEIGIRKVLGASIPGLILMLMRQFLRWVVLSNVIAWPVAYFLMNRWLQEYAYRIEFGWWICPLAGGVALVVTLMTVGYQTMKTTTANPVKSLRYE